MGDYEYEENDSFYDDSEFNSEEYTDMEDEQSSVSLSINEEEGINSLSSEDGNEDEEDIEPAVYSLPSDEDMIVEDVEDSNDTEEESAKVYSISLDDDLVVEESEDEVLSAEEKLRVFSDTVISALIGSKGIRQHALNRLMMCATPRLFRDENYIIFSVLYTFRDKIRHIKIDSEFIRMFLVRNRGMIVKAKNYIDLHSYEEVDGSQELGYISGVVKYFKRLEVMEDMSETDFNTAYEKYLIEFKAVETSKVYDRARTILLDGLKVGNKFLYGFNDSQLYVRRELNEIEGLTDMTKGKGYVKMSEIIMGEKGEEKKPIKIADFDKLAKLNEYYGGIFTGMFYQVMAPAKSGKSKLCARVHHTACVKYGTNVTVWAVEGGYDAWTAQLRAIHFDYTYNSGVSLTERKFGVNQDVVQKDNFPSEELRDLEMSSKLDLASNPDYGQTDYIDAPFNVETFIDSIDVSVKSNGSKLVIIDYLQLIMSESSKTSKTETIANAYVKLLKYCKDNNITVITPAQYKQETINALMSTKDTSDSEMRTAGGNSAEVIRTPDITFAMWASTSDLANNRMKILSMPSRFAQPFPEIPCVTDLGVCQFISEE